MTLVVRTSAALLAHLRLCGLEEEFFGGGRLQYPGRREIEVQLGRPEPYTIDLEARVIEGLPRRAAAAVRFLSAAVTRRALRDPECDPTLELLWAAHGSYGAEPWSPSLDRLVAALVGIEEVRSGRPAGLAEADAAVVLVTAMHAVGFPPTREGLEELFDGAPPACVGLGPVEV